MKQLRISGVRDLTFGRHVDRRFDGMDADFVVVHGPNESGKSTLAEFLVWAVGGPWRRFAENTEAFRGKTDGRLRGTLLGRLGDDVLHLDAQFKLKLKGFPDDIRKGTIGAHDVDTAALKRNLGNLTPIDYQLIYRLYGASLGDVYSSTNFSELFTNFAMGSEAAVANPRKRLELLKAARSSAGDDVKEAQKELSLVKTEIREVLQIPAQVNQLKADIEHLLSDANDDLERLGELRLRKALLERARDGLGFMRARAEAQAALERAPAPSPEWTKVALNMADVEAAVTAIAKVDEDVTRQEPATDQALRRCGLDRAQVLGQTLTAAQRLELSIAARSLAEARDKEKTGRDDHAVLLRARDDMDREIGRLLGMLGLDASQLDEVDRQEVALEAAADRATQWRIAVNEVIAAEGRLAASTAGSSGSTPGGTRGWPAWTLVAAIMGVGVLGSVHWLASTVAAVVVAILAFQSRARLVPSDHGSAAGRANRVRDEAEIARQRAVAAGLQREIGLSLGALGAVVTNADTGVKSVELLRELAMNRVKSRGLEEQIAAAAEVVDRAVAAVAAARTAVEQKFVPRGIPVGVAENRFDEWLVVYEEAVGAISELERMRGQRAEFARRLDELTVPVKADLAGLGQIAVVERVGSARADLDAHRAAQAALATASGKVEAANLDTDEIRDLMRHEPTEESLKVQMLACDEEIREVETNRDAKLGTRRSKEDEVKRLEQSDQLQSLQLSQGALEERIEEAAFRHRAAELAVTVLSDEIDTYERENQDPVVATASSMIAEVVPGWGVVIMSRDEDNVPVLRRSSSSGTVDEHAISDGGRALLHLGIRLAFAQKDAERRSIALPIICDDPLVHFDDERRAAAIALLHERSAYHQVLLFTCDDDTRDLAKALGAAVVQI